MTAPTGWNTPFDFPVRLPSGGSLRTLRQAAEYLDGLPERDQRRPEWQQAASDLLKAATLDRAWRFFAARSVYVALHGDRPAPLPPRPPTLKQRRQAWKRGQAKG